MKSKCLHNFQVTGTKDESNRRFYFLTCSKCPKTSHRSRKLVRAQFDSPKQTKTPQKGQKRKRKAIPGMSSQKRKWTDLYREKHEADPEIVTGYDLKWNDRGEPVIVPVKAHKLSFDRHHTGRRHRWLILWYSYVSPVLHAWIEANSAKAREMGLLFSVESGHLRNPSPHDPLNCMEEFRCLQDKYIFTTVLR